ncbi:MAG TPA: UxaA family hydrolase [Deltaproteobacteria bacterium]|nr:UxaA family hydrolase [Deltaproteobacteria bacterium]
MKINGILIHPGDNVAVALEDMHAGDALNIRGRGSVDVLDDIPCGHKVAVEDIRAGSAVIKYGEAIARAATDISRGRHVHTHNLATEDM